MSDDLANWWKTHVWQRIVLPLGEPEYFKDPEPALSEQLKVTGPRAGELSAFLLQEARDMDQGVYDSAQSLDQRAVALQGAVAVAATLVVAAGGLLLGTTVTSEAWRVIFAIFGSATVMAFILSGLRALGASSRTHPWTHPGYEDIFDHAGADLVGARSMYAAGFLKSVGMNQRIIEIKAGYLNSAVFWFKLALAGLATLAVLFVLYAICRPGTTTAEHARDRVNRHYHFR